MKLEYALVDLNDDMKISEVINIKEKTKDGHIYFNQYQRGKRKKILNFAVKVLSEYNLEKISVYLNNNINQKFTYDKETSYFYITNEIGIEKAGFFYLSIVDLQGSIIYKSDKILVKPSIISMDMYEEMVDMLLNINITLVNQEEAETYLEKDGKKVNLSEYIVNLLTKLEGDLDNINSNPTKRLIKVEKKVSYSKIKKFSSKILLEKEIYPFKEKFLSEIVIEDLNIYENRMIYNFLLDIKKFIEINKFEIERSLNNIEFEIMEMDSLLLEYNNQEYKNNLKRKKEKNIAKITKCKIQLKNWNLCEKVLSKYLNLDIFRSFKEINFIKEELKITQLFIHDIFYNKIYHAMKKFYDGENDKKVNIDNEELNIKNLYDIFEIWSYFYMVKVMVREQGWTISNRINLISSINNYIRERGNLYGFIVNLEHDLGNDKKANLRIIYNKTLKLSTENLRPDFTFEFDINNDKKIFYLDAKYHNYLEEGFEGCFNKDLEQTARDKYYLKTQATQYKATGSYILHCINEKRYRYFGGNKENNHRIGGFAILPTNHNDFKVWISLIMEWFYNEYEVCWNCGSLNIDVKYGSTKGNNIKKHITCNCCGSFWVKTNCESCECRKIIKHDLRSKQYHKGTSEKWMVHCPKCGSSGNVNLQNTYVRGCISKKNRYVIDVEVEVK